MCIKKLLLCTLSLTSSALGMHLVPGAPEGQRFANSWALERILGSSHQLWQPWISCNEQGQPTVIHGHDPDDYDVRSIRLAGTYTCIRGHFFALSWQRPNYTWKTHISSLDTDRPGPMHGERRIQTRETLKICEGRCHTLLDDGTTLIETVGEHATCLETTTEGRRGLKIYLYNNRPRPTRNGKGHAGICHGLRIPAKSWERDFADDRPCIYSWDTYKNMLLFCTAHDNVIHQFCFYLASEQQIELPDTPEAANAMNNVLNNLPSE